MRIYWKCGANEIVVDWKAPSNDIHVHTIVHTNISLSIDMHIAILYLLPIKYKPIFRYSNNYIENINLATS